MDKSWMTLIRDRLSPRYLAGVDAFIEFAKVSACGGSTIRCPCNKCMNLDRREFDIVQDHLVRYGIMVSYKIWLHHGEWPDNQQGDSDDDTDGNKDEDKDGYPELLEDHCKGTYMDDDDEKAHDTYGRLVNKSIEQSQSEVTSPVISTDVLGRRPGYLKGYEICFRESSSTRSIAESAERDAEMVALKEKVAKQIAAQAEQIAAQAQKIANLEAIVRYLLARDQPATSSGG